MPFMPISLLLRPGLQTKEHLRFLGKWLVGKFTFGVLREMAPDQVIDVLTALAGIDLHAVVFTLEAFNDGQSLRLEGIESQLDTFDVVVTSAGELCATEDALFENRVRALEVQHFRQLGVAAEDLMPRFQIIQ